jgi:ornithine carbamoyltransferase
VALVFEKPSARTRNSSEMAVVQLGGHPVTIRGEEVGFDVRESVEDVTRTLGCYHAVIAARVYDHRTLERMHDVSPVPVVNLLSDLAHPCQALADLLTLRQRWGSLEGRTIAWVGDWNNVARSLAIGARLSGMSFRAAGPAGYGPGEDADARGVVVAGSAAEAVDGADAVVTDTWTSMGQETETAARRQAFAGWTVDEALMGKAAPDAVFLHCLPAHRGEEVADEVLDGPRSLVWPEAENRMHVMRGIFGWVLS